MLIVRGNIEPHYLTGGLPGWLRESACNAGDLSSIPGLGRSPGEGNGNPPQYSCLENPHGQRTLAGCSPWDHKESHMSQGLRLFSRLWTWKVLHFPFHKEIKSGRADRTFCLVWGLKGQYDQTCMDSFENKGFQDYVFHSGGDVSIAMADPCWCMAETNNIVVVLKLKINKLREKKLVTGLL